jgi:hypothetical protein
MFQRTCDDNKMIQPSLLTIDDNIRNSAVCRRIVAANDEVDSRDYGCPEVDFIENFDMGINVESISKTRNLDCFLMPRRESDVISQQTASQWRHAI